jgi:1-acyl-sn-glycerol-3-phosphate acyltransferase
MRTEANMDTTSITQPREPAYAGPHTWQIQPWARWVRRAMRYRACARWVERYCRPLTVTGRERLVGLRGPFIVIANHQSHTDSLVLGNFPIARGGGFKALGHAGWLLQHGCNVAVCPEGTRATGQTPGQFRHGVAKLALLHDVPVVPVYLGGPREMQPKGQLHVTPGRTFAEILLPVRFAPGMPVTVATARPQALLSERHRVRCSMGDVARAA